MRDGRRGSEVVVAHKGCRRGNGYDDRHEGDDDTTASLNDLVAEDARTRQRIPNATEAKIDLSSVTRRPGEREDIMEERILWKKRTWETIINRQGVNYVSLKLGSIDTELRNDNASIVYKSFKE